MIFNKHIKYVIDCRRVSCWCSMHCDSKFYTTATSFCSCLIYYYHILCFCASLERTDSDSIYYICIFWCFACVVLFTVIRLVSYNTWRDIFVLVIWQILWTIHATYLLCTVMSALWACYWVRLSLIIPHPSIDRLDIKTHTYCCPELWSSACPVEVSMKIVKQ